MKKYIEADELKLKVNHEMDMQDTYLPAHFFEVVDDMPAADVAEVRHGRWEKLYGGNYKCSVCGAWYRCVDDYFAAQPMDYLYCPNCGAKMGEGGDTE